MEGWVIKLGSKLQATPLTLNIQSIVYMLEKYWSVQFSMYIQWSEGVNNQIETANPHLNFYLQHSQQ